MKKKLYFSAALVTLGVVFSLFGGSATQSLKHVLNIGDSKGETIVATVNNTSEQGFANRTATAATKPNTITVGATVPTTNQRFENVQKELTKLGDQYGITIGIQPLRDRLSYATWDLVTEKDVTELEKMTRYLNDEWVKYPKDFVKKSKLQHIFLVKKLYVDNMQYRAATPDPYYDQAVYYDIGSDYLDSEGGDYMRNVIHHEYGHLVEYNVYGSFAWNDTTWAACNIKPFTYGGGGYLAYSNAEFANTKHAVDGFVTGYGTYGIEEDKAEVFAELMTNYDAFKDLSQADSHLKCKFDLYQGYLHDMSGSFTTSYLDQRS